MATDGPEDDDSVTGSSKSEGGDSAWAGEPFANEPADWCGSGTYVVRTKRPSDGGFTNVVALTQHPDKLLTSAGHKLSEALPFGFLEIPCAFHSNTDTLDLPGMCWFVNDIAEDGTLDFFDPQIFHHPQSDPNDDQDQVTRVVIKLQMRVVALEIIDADKPK